MPSRTWNVYRLPTKDAACSLEEIGTYEHVEAENLKANSIINLGGDSYRIVFFVHTGSKRSGGNLVVAPTT